MSTHTIDITRDRDGVHWACPVCNWGGLGEHSEDSALAEHAKIAAGIAAGRIPPGDVTPTLDEAAAPAPAETSAEGERRQMACPMTHLPEMPCGTCGKPAETGERRA